MTSERREDSRGERHRIKVAMLTSLRERCGIAEYSYHLVGALRSYVDVAWVAEATDFVPAMNEADVVHIQHQYFLYGGVAPWKNTFGRVANGIEVPAVMTVHEFVPPAGNLLRRMAIASTNRAQFGHPAIKAFVVHTEEDRRNLIGCDIPAERILVHPIPSPPCSPAPPRDEARRSLGLQHDFVVTIFGFLARRKGHLLAIEALRRLPEEVRLVFAGGVHPDDRTGYEKEIHDAILAAGLRRRVLITGYLDDVSVAAYMAATDLILAPFLHGSGSASLAAAFAHGKPVLASAIAPNVELERRCPGCMELVKPGSADELAGAIARLMRAPEALERLREGALEYARRFTYDSLARATARLYEDVTKAARR